MTSEGKDPQAEQDSQEGFSGADATSITRVSGMYQDYFLDYASYVILERAVPALEDGLKPVQRRILHAMFGMEDGRYHKVANVIGQTMRFHPHGDASIGDALVQLGQKDIVIDTQGNWGNVLTGDSAAAPRYIEARLSKFALEVIFSPKVTHWQSSYDGRADEPINLPVKFPLLLAQGVEGIAVGLSTRILPHNFNELIDGSIKILKGKKVEIFPDFPTGGIADFTQYNDGARGGRVRVRAKIQQLEKKNLLITEIPFGTTTQSLIDSILKANDKGKIKIKKIEDNTAENVEILIQLPAGISPDKTIDALYAFTDCEVSIAPLGCVIVNDNPEFLGVSEILERSTKHTLSLLRRELEIKLHELQEQWHFASLERIFIENRIYRDIEEAETWEQVISFIRKGLEPHIANLIRKVTDDDIVRLTEIRIKRISKFDADKANDRILQLEGSIAEVKHHLAHIVDFAINYFKALKKKYGDGRERKTEIRIFDDIVATKVAIANAKLYVNREEGFVGTGLKKDEFVCDCSDIDDVIVIQKDGTMTVTKVAPKVFVGKDILHVAVFKRNDKRTIYNMIYQEGKSKVSYVKRFSITSITRDKPYNLAGDASGGKVLYLTVNPNGEAEVVTVHLRALQKLRKLRFDLDFADIAIKGRQSKGNIVSKYPIKKIELREKGISTLAARKIWFDDTVQRLNADGRGTLLGAFKGDDKILTAYQNGTYRLSNFDLATHFDEDMVLIEKWKPKQPITLIYWDNGKKRYFVKRFLLEDVERKESLIGDAQGSYLELISTAQNPTIEVSYKKVKGVEKETEQINLEDFIAVKGWKAQGNQLTADAVKEINLIDFTEDSSAEEKTFKEEDSQPNEKETENEKKNNKDAGDQQISLEF